MVRLLKRLSLPAKETPDPAVEATEEGRLWGVKRTKSFNERLNVGMVASVCALTLVAAPVRWEFMTSFLLAATTTSLNCVTLSPMVMFKRRLWPKLNCRPSRVSVV